MTMGRATSHSAFAGRGTGRAAAVSMTICVQGAVRSARRRVEVELANRDDVNGRKPEPRQLVDEGPRVAHQHDRQAIGLEVGARHALDDPPA